MAPVETFEAFGYYFRAESAQLLRNRLPHKFGLFKASANSMGANLQPFGMVDEAPIQILGVADKSLASGSKTGRCAGRP